MRQKRLRMRMHGIRLYGSTTVWEYMLFHIWWATHDCIVFNSECLFFLSLFFFILSILCISSPLFHFMHSFFPLGSCELGDRWYNVSVWAIYSYVISSLIGDLLWIFGVNLFFCCSGSCMASSVEITCRSNSASLRVPGLGGVKEASYGREIDQQLTQMGSVE